MIITTENRRLLHDGQRSFFVTESIDITILDTVSKKSLKK